jgi:replication-associated recombination protein RarA
MPDGVKSQTYYEPTSNGREAKIRERLERLRGKNDTEKRDAETRGEDA